MTTVGWIGLGHIGTPMAQRVRAAGFELLVWARRRDAAAPLVEAGAVWCDDVLELARRCDTVCTCVGGPDDVLDLHRRLMPAARPGTLFIDLSTASPATAVESARIASGVGVQVLDAPVTGGVAGATRGTLTTFVGGSAEALARARPLLQAFSARIAPCGPSGGGYRVKLINQLLMVGSLLAVADAAMLARAAGLDGAALKDALAGGSGSSALVRQLLAAHDGARRRRQFLAGPAAQGPAPGARRSAGLAHADAPAGRRAGRSGCGLPAPRPRRRPADAALPPRRLLGKGAVSVFGRPGATDMSPTDTIGLPALERRLAHDLACLQLPAPRWTPELLHDGQPVADVAIVGAGMAGLALAAALIHRGLAVAVYDEAPAGLEGPWATTRAWKRCAAPSSWPGRRWASRR
jgi:2-hydroxy-3-oxopropionate reductase